MTLKAWLAAFVGQVAWLFDMEVGYLLVYWACGTKQTWVLPLATAVAFVVALTGFAVSLTSARLGSASDSAVGASMSAGAAAAPGVSVTGASMTGASVTGADAGSIERFVGIAGMALNGIAMLVILAMGVPRVMLDPCK